MRHTVCQSHFSYVQSLQLIWWIFYCSLEKKLCETVILVFWTKQSVNTEPKPVNTVVNCYRLRKTKSCRYSHSFVVTCCFESSVLNLSIRWKISFEKDLLGLPLVHLRSILFSTMMAVCFSRHPIRFIVFLLLNSSWFEEIILPNDCFFALTRVTLLVNNTVSF